jgi:hypothetical protein
MRRSGQETRHFGGRVAISFLARHGGCLRCLTIAGHYSQQLKTFDPRKELIMSRHALSLMVVVAASFGFAVQEADAQISIGIGKGGIQIGNPSYCPPKYCPPNYCPPKYCPPVYCPPKYCPPCIARRRCAIRRRSSARRRK